MNFDQAVELALEIRQTRPAWIVIAVGHFTMPDEITPDSPAGVSVLEPGADRPRVIWKLADMYPAQDSIALAGKDATATAAPAEEPSVPGMLF